MTDDLIEQLAQIQRYTATLQEAVSAAQAHAPTQSAGSDQSRTVQVLLDGDGLPQSFHVSNDWKRRIEPANFGSAVLEACQDGTGERLSVWTKALQEEGWEDKLAEMRNGPTDSSAAQEASRVAPTIPGPLQTQPPRDLSDVTEDVLKALDAASELTQSPRSDAATGSAADGRLSITLSRAGLTSCDADSRWVSNQTAARLMDALGEALSHAKQELANNSEPERPQERLNSLFGEAMALLNQPDRLVD